ncbi:MFS transporter [Jannaschia sp. LMIT008]|uniref:MFS transporter n=1 Tax=Jannaschia maritima TaxID=3032585 RepID=UPI002811BFF6|nr:MFS transporter [Jannaschia sp. LMIT008]
MSILSALALSRAPFTAFVAVGLAWGSFAAAVPDIKARLGVEDATFGLLLLGTAIGLSTTLWAAARWDRGLGRWAMPAGTILLAVAMQGLGWAAIPIVFFLALTIAGACSGLTDVVMNSRVAEIEARSGQSLMNVNHAMFSVAYGVSALLTGFLREAGLPLEGIFAVTGCLILVTAPFQFMRVDPVDEAGAKAARLPLAVVGLCGGIVLIAFMSEATVESWSALHIERTLGGGAAEGAFGPAMLGFTMAVGRFSGQAVAARMSEVAVIRIAAALAATGVLIAAAAPSPAVAYLGFGLLGLGISVIGPMGLALAGRLSDPRVRTAVIARVAVIGFTGFFFAPALMGLGADAFGLRVAFALVAVLIAGLWPLTVAAKSR